MGFVLSDDDLIPPSAGETARAPWRQRDVQRAIAAAEKAGLASFRVEIAPDGTISIVVGDPEGGGKD